jgi:uridine kinase
VADSPAPEAARPSGAAASDPVARVILLAGPSGSGKSHLAERAALPTVCLDDFYRDGDDPSLPRCELGIVDWDDLAAWDGERAMDALVRLATTGEADLPIYDISQDRTVGAQRLQLGGAPLFVAEGIFAAELVRRCERAGILADALCLTHRPIVTFWRRLVRDLREGRKAPLTLVRRGLALRRDEPAIVARQIALGAVPVVSSDALRRLERARAATTGPVDDELAA